MTPKSPVTSVLFRSVGRSGEKSGVSTSLIRRPAGPSALIAALLLAGVCRAQSPSAVDIDDLPPELRSMIQAIITQPRVSPGVAFGSPIGFGASGGDYFIGLNGATADNADAPGADNDFIGDIALDGSLTAGIGLGNPRTALGVELAVNVTSLRDDFGDSGSVALKIHRLIGPRGALSIGTENDIAWGDVKDVVDATTGTRFVSYSHYFQLRDDPVNPGGLMITVGIGDGRLGKRSDPEDPAPFASIGYAFTRQISAIVDYSGEATNIGLSVVPWRHLPISAVFGATDVGERRGDTEFAFGIGYSMPLLTVYAKEPR